MELEKIIKQCKAGDRSAQKVLYDQYSPVLMGICRRYLGKSEDANDVFLEGMFKIFDKIKSYKGDGSFEGWMKRIMVNECLMWIRKNKKMNLVVEWTQIDQPEPPKIYQKLAMEEMKEIIDELPPGYKTVFNMYVLDGYKHREIAEELGISINTSKSQLILAKKKMQELLKKKDLDEMAS